MKIIQLVSNLSPSLLIVLFTGYVFFYAQLKDWVGDLTLLLMLIVALPRFCYMERHAKSVSLLWFVFSIYGCLVLSSFFFNPSEFIHPNWTIATFPRFIFAAVIVLSFQGMSKREVTFYSWVLALAYLLLTAGYMFQSLELNGPKGSFFLNRFQESQAQWHWKNYAFWQVFLTWGVAMYFWRKSLGKSVFTICVILGSGCVLFYTPIESFLAESAILALAVGIIVFLLAHIKKATVRYTLYWGLFAFLAFLPIIWVIVMPVEPMINNLLAPIGGESGFAISIRVQIMDACAYLVRQSLYVGYGSGSTLTLQVPNGFLTNWPGTSLPGGHPHNLGFLFLLEHGLLGYLFMISVLFLFFRYVFHCMKGQNQDPAVLACMASGVILFSLSYSVWHADVVLMYCMFLALITGRCSVIQSSPYSGK